MRSVKLSIPLFVLAAALTQADTADLEDRQRALAEAAVPAPDDEGLTGDGADTFSITIDEARNALYSHRIRIYYENDLIPAYVALSSDAITSLSSLESAYVTLQTNRDIWRVVAWVTSGSFVVSLLAIALT